MNWLKRRLVIYRLRREMILEKHKIEKAIEEA